MTARANPNSFCPPDMGGRQGGRIRDYLREVLGTDFKDVRGVGIGLQVALTTTTTSGSDKYQVPSDQELVIFGIQGYLQMPTLDTEPQIVARANVDPSERWFAKSQNCTVQLSIKERSLNVFDQRAVPLSAFTPPVGSALWFPPETPIIISRSLNLEGTFTLTDTDADIVGNSTNYGLLCFGALVSLDR